MTVKKGFRKFNFAEYQYACMHAIIKFVGINIHCTYLKSATHVENAIMDHARHFQFNSLCSSLVNVSKLHDHVYF